MTIISKTIKALVAGALILGGAVEANAAASTFFNLIHMHIFSLYS